MLKNLIKVYKVIYRSWTASTTLIVIPDPEHFLSIFQIDRDIMKRFKTSSPETNPKHLRALSHIKMSGGIGGGGGRVSLSWSNYRKVIGTSNRL